MLDVRIKRKNSVFCPKRLDWADTEYGFKGTYKFGFWQYYKKKGRDFRRKNSPEKWKRLGSRERPTALSPLPFVIPLRRDLPSGRDVGLEHRTPPPFVIPRSGVSSQRPGSRIGAQNVCALVGFCVPIERTGRWGPPDGG